MDDEKEYKIAQKIFHQTTRCKILCPFYRLASIISFANHNQTIWWFKSSGLVNRQDQSLYPNVDPP
jgi:hypothetical protein